MNPKVFFNEFEEVLEEFNEEDFVEEEFLSGLDKARLKKEEKKKMAEEVAKELGDEFGLEVDDGIERIEREEKIDRVSGFENQ